MLLSPFSSSRRMMRSMEISACGWNVGAALTIDPPRGAVTQKQHHLQVGGEFILAGLTRHLHRERQPAAD